jgi:4-hydroxybenzoate polyprenyltransferase
MAEPTNIAASSGEEAAPRRSRLGFVIWGLRHQDLAVVIAFPTTASLLAIAGWDLAGLRRFLLLCLCHYLFLNHVFIFNDWSDAALNPAEPARRKRHALKYAAFTGPQLLVLSAVLLAAALAGYAMLGPQIWRIAAFVTVITVAYSHPWINLKGQPLFSTVIHFIGAFSYFLMGWIAFAKITPPALGLGLFFGLVLAAGHFANEIQDFDSDLIAGIRTNTIAYGQRRMFRAGLALFVLSSAWLVFISIRLPDLAPAWPFQFIAFALLYFWLGKTWEYRAWNGGDDIIPFRRSYRVVYAGVCAAMILIKLYQWGLAWLLPGLK